MKEDTSHGKSGRNDGCPLAEVGSWHVQAQGTPLDVVGCCW